jgi:hypothetical protein
MKDYEDKDNQEFPGQAEKAAYDNQRGCRLPWTTGLGHKVIDMGGYFTLH